MNAARPTTERGFERHIADPLFAPVQVTRAARSEKHSRPRPRLKDAESADPEGDERTEPPPAGGPPHNQRDADADSNGEHGDARHEPLSPLPRPDVYVRATNPPTLFASLDRPRRISIALTSAGHLPRDEPRVLRFAINRLTTDDR